MQHQHAAAQLQHVAKFGTHWSAARWCEMEMTDWGVQRTAMTASATSEKFGRRTSMLQLSESQVKSQSMQGHM